jgi:hypothetical protein
MTCPTCGLECDNNSTSIAVDGSIVCQRCGRRCNQCGEIHHYMQINEDGTCGTCANAELGNVGVSWEGPSV